MLSLNTTSIALTSLIVFGLTSLSACGSLPSKTKDAATSEFWVVEVERPHGMRISSDYVLTCSGGKSFTRRFIKRGKQAVFRFESKEYTGKISWLNRFKVEIPLETVINSSPTPGPEEKDNERKMVFYGSLKTGEGYYQLVESRFPGKNSGCKADAIFRRVL